MSVVPNYERFLGNCQSTRAAGSCALANMTILMHDKAKNLFVTIWVASTINAPIPKRLGVSHRLVLHNM